MCCICENLIEKVECELNPTGWRRVKVIPGRAQLLEAVSEQGLE